MHLRVTMEGPGKRGEKGGRNAGVVELGMRGKQAALTLSPYSLPLLCKNRSSSGSAAQLEFDIACIRCTPHPIVRVKRIKYFLAADDPENSNETIAPHADSRGFRSQIKINRTPIDRMAAPSRARLRFGIIVRSYNRSNLNVYVYIHVCMERRFQMTVEKAGFSRSIPDFQARRTARCELT